jgi:hypothetical protein
MNDFSSQVKHEILRFDSYGDIEPLCLEVFRYQAEKNLVYKQYLKLLRINSSNIRRLEEIPFLPIRFFKSKEVICSSLKPEKVFLSSGTTGQQRSRHLVADLVFYETVTLKIFESFFPSVDKPVILALLPTYSDNPQSSLLHMIGYFQDQYNCQGYQYLTDDFPKLRDILSNLVENDKPIFLWGVTYALLDFANFIQKPFTKVNIVETGGMKGTRSELTKMEVYHALKSCFGVQSVISEYGMGELLSQAYALQDGEFTTPWWMKVLVRSVNDPFETSQAAGRGAMNIIDLANIDSCCFVETEDLGELMPDGKFKIYGRIEHAEIRGCNLMWI